MNSQRLTGWLLIIGPVLTFLVWALLWPMLIGSGETSADQVAEGVAKPELVRVLSAIGVAGFASFLLGFVLLARSMQGEDKPGAGCVAVAGILFVVTATMAAVAGTSSIGVLELAIEQNDVATAVMVNAAGNAIFSGVPLIWSIALILLGTTIVKQKNLHVAVGWLFAVFGAVMLVYSVSHPVETNSSGDQVISMMIWIGISLITVATGVLTLRARQTS